MTFAGSDILPDNATDLQRVLADFEWDRLSDLDLDVIRRVIDPWACPVALLPWLAAQFSVDTWEETWSEQTRRAVIAASPEVHRLKGTRKAVRLAAEALGLETEIKEWWEFDPPARRGTFQVTVWGDLSGDGPLLDERYTRNVIDAVRGAKPKSRVMILNVAWRLASPVRTASVVFAHDIVTVYPATGG